MFNVSADALSRRKGRSRPTPIGGVLGRVISSLGISDSYNGWMVITHWEEIVGVHIAKNAPAFRFEEGIVYVNVPDAAWRQTLTLQSEELIKQIHSYPFGKGVTSIRFVAGKRGNQ